MQKHREKQTRGEAPSGLAVAYLRVSTDDQSIGLQSQREAIARHVAGAKLELIALNVDENISGAAPVEGRPALIASLAQLGPGDVLLVARRDRLGRDPMVVGMVEASAIRKGARVVSCAGEGTDGDDPTSILMRRIIDAFAEFERLMIRTRTRAAIDSLRRRGRVYGHVPYGFRAIDSGPRTKSSGGLAAGSLAVDHEEMRTINQVCEANRQGLSARAIAMALDAAMVPTRTGRPWSHQSVRSILLRAKSGAVALDEADAIRAEFDRPFEDGEARDHEAE